MIAVWLYLTVQQVGLQFVIVVFPDHTHLSFLCVSENNTRVLNKSFEQMVKIPKKQVSMIR